MITSSIYYIENLSKKIKNKNCIIKKTKPILLILSLILFASWHNTEGFNLKDEKKNHQYDLNADSTKILGFDFLSKIVGLWSGPVYSSTPAGSFDNWNVDFRPVSAGQVSQYTTFDTSALNYTSFFIVKHNGKLKIAMRTQGVFNNKGCVTYEVMDTVNESIGYFRFSDIQSGTKRAYTEFHFKNDELIMEVYTNKFNKVNPLQLHSRWTAKLGGREAAAAAISHFNFPQPIMIKDFSDIFNNMTESIYYTFEKDPYPSSPQPYVGSVNVNISIDKKLKIKGNEELFLLLSTEPLFEGLKYKRENLKYESKYVFLPVKTKSFTITNVHPGKYYLYSFIDVNGDKKHTSGDYMCSDANNFFTLLPTSTAVVNTTVDMVIP